MGLTGEETTAAEESTEVEEDGGSDEEWVDPDEKARKRKKVEAWAEIYWFA